MIDWGEQCHRLLVCPVSFVSCAEKKAKAAAIASEAIHVSSPGSKRLGGAKSDNRDYQLLGAADADHLGRDGMTIY